MLHTSMYNESNNTISNGIKFNILLTGKYIIGAKVGLVELYFNIKLYDFMNRL